MSDSEKSPAYQEGYTFGLENIKDENRYYELSQKKNPYPYVLGRYSKERQDWAEGMSYARYDLEQWGVLGDPLKHLQDGVGIDDWDDEDDDYDDEDEEDTIGP